MRCGSASPRAAALNPQLGLDDRRGLATIRVRSDTLAVMPSKRKSGRPSASKGRPSPAPESESEGHVVAPLSNDSVIVGIGASAGGLEALKAFFAAVPEHSGLTFVVVIHLDPTHESFMPDLIARGTSLRVEAARDRQPMQPNHVYVDPAESGSDRRAAGHPSQRAGRSPWPVRGHRPVLSVRSPTSDGNARSASSCQAPEPRGMLGARAIKAGGGMVMAQAPETAGQPGMPSSAIATGLVDLVLPPDAMPEALINFDPSTLRGSRCGPNSRSAGG